MSQEYDYKTVKKELSRKLALDSMKKDLLDAIPEKIWEQIIERESIKFHVEQEEVETSHINSLESSHGSHQRHDGKWEDVLRTSLKLGHIPEINKDIIFRKWEQRMDGSIYHN